MESSKAYKNNSQQKDFIRKKWIEFAKAIYGEAEHEFGIITFPAEAMQDLYLFKNEGFIDWEEVEAQSTGEKSNYKVIKGNVRCFEKQASIFKVLNQKLTNKAKVNHTDFCAYIAAEYPSIMSGRNKTFPVDVVNLDFEGRLHADNRYPFDITAKCIFEFQKRHKRNFSLFVTWPVVEDEDLVEYKEMLHKVIENNLEDPSATNFKVSFENAVGSIDDLYYERKSIIGVTKVLIKKASQNLYVLEKNEFYAYGGKEERQRMISLLFNFRYDGRIGRENIIYAHDVAKSMLAIVDVNDIDLE